MLKKSLNIILIVLIIAAVGFGSYYFFVLKKNPLTNNPVTVPDFWPFGQGTETTNDAGSVNDSNQPLLPEADNEILDPGGEIIKIRQLTRDPVAGFVALDVDEGAGVRYVDRATGHIFDVSLESSLLIRKSNTTIPKVVEAHWNHDGSGVLLRYLAQDNETIENQLGILGDEIESENDSDALQELVITKLRSGIQEVTLAPDKNRIAYLIKNGDSKIYITDFNNQNEVLVTDLDISEWIIDWPTNNMFALTTKASSVVRGYSYLLDINSKNLTKTIGNTLGLTTNYQSDEMVLVNSSLNNLNLVARNISTNTVVSIPIRTLPEKCVWGDDSNIVYCAAPRSVPNASYPEDWYIGKISFNDDLWRFNIETSELTLITNFNPGQAIDVVSPQLSPDGEYLLFTNKVDGTLWSVLLTA